MIGKGAETGLRSAILAQRRALRAEEVTRRSQRVCDRVLAAFKESGTSPRAVGIYHALPDELNLEFLQAALLAQGTRLFFPRVRDLATKELELAPMPRASQDWVIGAYGIREPGPAEPAINPAELDLIFVPGVAFGRAGERLGMGAGFYDRFLPKTRPDCIRVAAIFDFQLLSGLEQQSWDQRVDWIIGETHLIRVR